MKPLRCAPNATEFPPPRTLRSKTSLAFRPGTEGELWVAGRVDDMIISGGENIHPVEVEEVLARHPGVRDAAVVGEPDERWGERVVAFVVPGDPALTVEALDAYCHESPDLANFKRPRRVVFVREIPKTASGKILRRLLREGRDTEIRA